MLVTFLLLVVVIGSSDPYSFFYGSDLKSEYGSEATFSFTLPGINYYCCLIVKNNRWIGKNCTGSLFIDMRRHFNYTYIFQLTNVSFCVENLSTGIRIPSTNPDAEGL